MKPHILCVLTGVHSTSLEKEISTESERKIIQTAAELWQRCQDLGLNRTLEHAGELEKKSVISFKYVRNARFIMCDLPFSGSNDWLKSTNATRNAYQVDRGKLTIESKLSAKEKMDGFNYRLKKYYKVLAIRHPFERLVAIYKQNNKLDHFRHEQDLDHIRAIKSYIVLLDENNKKRRGGVFKLTFKQFVGFVLHSPSNFYYWRTHYEICAPCTIRYNDITSLSWDLERKKRLAKRMKVHPDSTQLNYIFKDHNDTEWVKYYSAITLSDQENLYALYKYDFELFGYNWPFTSGDSGTLYKTTST